MLHTQLVYTLNAQQAHASFGFCLQYCVWLARRNYETLRYAALVALLRAVQGVTPHQLRTAHVACSAQCSSYIMLKIGQVS